MVVRVVVRVIVRVIVWRGVAALAIHPARVAVDVVFLFPDRDPVLHFVDDEAAGLERLVTVRGADAHPHCKFTDAQVAEAVHAGDPCHAEPFAGRGENALTLAQGERFERFILEVFDLAAFVEIPHPALECDKAAKRRIGQPCGRGGGIDRFSCEAEAGQVALVSRRQPAE